MHLLVFEPRLEGHHLSWLRYVAEDFLSAGYRITIALDRREVVADLYREHMNGLLRSVSTISVYDDDKRFKAGSRLASLAACLNQSHADHAFVNNLDDIASSMLRRASVGCYPPTVLKGKISGVYFRPRFLANAKWPPGNFIKNVGFHRLMRRDWFHRICLMDEYLYQKHVGRWPHALLFLPDPWSGAFTADKAAARRELGIDTGKFVLLHYGIGTRRKGLHLILRAMQTDSVAARWHLLCAGRIADDAEISRGLHRLADQGRATVLNRYVSKAEEQLCFAGSDVVLLPYVRHFGSSGVLALAAAAGKMVVASDEGLVARRVQERGLGLCFPSGSTDGLREALRKAEATLAADPNAFCEAAGRFAAQCDRTAFRKAIGEVFVQKERRSMHSGKV
jgi:glycosyltransferase involved in cell wall biosynthesis